MLLSVGGPGMASNAEMQTARAADEKGRPDESGLRERTQENVIHHVR